MSSNHFPKALLARSLKRKTKQPIWFASHFSMSRNLASLPFPHKMTEDEASQTLKSVGQSLLKSSILKHPLFLSGETLKEQEKTLLHKHFLIPPPCSTHRCKEGYIIDATASVLVTINRNDHLLFQCITPESQWKKSWDKLSALEKELHELYGFAYSDEFGYLTSELSCCGTALYVQVSLHLPCLIHLKPIKDLLKQEVDRENESFGIEGSQVFTGNLITIKNRFTIGLSEDHILEKVHKTATQLATLEKTTREKLKEKPHPFILDKISRSYGTLLYCCAIETKEALDALSFLKLGIDLQWVKGITDQKINEIFYTCRQKTCRQKALGTSLKEEELQKRAQYIHQALKKVTLHLP